jgi:hypothetical protein
MKTEVEFRSTAFNCTEPKDYFINECCFGDDVCQWLIGELRGRGFIATSEPGQEDFGWFATFEFGGVQHCFIVGFQPNDPAAGDRWLGCLERQTGFISSIFGRRKRGISPDAVALIDSVLRSHPAIDCIVWHEPGTDSRSDDRGEEEPASG